MMRLIGKLTLNDLDKIILDVAALLKDDFLQQSDYSDYAQFCPRWKTELYDEGVHWISLREEAVAQGHSWAKVRESTGALESELRIMKFEQPSEGKEAILKRLR